MNYRHLHYFWSVVRAGGVLRAAEQLHLTPQTLSSQIRLLEERVGQPLLRKAGRGVEPTEAGRLALQYAEEIFALGQELEHALRGGREAATPSPVLRVGIADAVPKAIAWHVLEPALRMSPPPRLQCSEGKLTALLAELALRRLELVVSDVPLPGHVGVRAYSHLLGRSAVSFFAAPALLQQAGLTLRGARARFPVLLAELPTLLPGPDSALRPRLDAWMRRQGVLPRVAGEFDDTALMKAFGREGSGVFAAPAVLAREIARQYEVQAIGTAGEVQEEFYGITGERRITQPAIAAITASARQELFAT
ncbi:transcriptional activator NhaR [Ramlibacter tataouinensis]|uniref:transcriptional activator NhaR n=1 Tax=Ramlibacter tataouinensis TaxID=94132 RepID=UPI0022F3AE37|nr:transcriptional activator NhaR [Ramlibacter tataouinensis]WBY00319.1 transcriptional activator NhaR [Ramlibacter tataouinensis]